MEILFSGNRIFHQNYLTSFLLGNLNHNLDGLISILNILYFIKSNYFKLYFRFIYCGNIELKNLQGPDVLKLLIAVDELNIQGFLIEHQTEFLYQNPTGILETVYQHETFIDLWNFCLEKVCEEPKILFDSDQFLNLKAPLLELLLKRDDLNLDEIEIWESLLKWCFAQQNVKNDQIKWSKDDITKIERALYRF